MGTTAQYLRVATVPLLLKMKLCLILAALLAVVVAEPWYGGLGYGYGGYGYGYNIGHGTGVSFVRRNQLWGRKKREAESDADAQPDAEADADPYYGYYGGQYAWPGYYGYGFERTCWGCRGKRSADADAYYGYGGYGGYYGGYGRGIARHWGGGISYRGRTIWGLRGKRSADAEPYFGYGGYGPVGYGYDYDLRSGRSYVARSGLGYWPGDNHF